MKRLIEWWRRGSALVWLSGGALALSLLMVAGLVTYLGAKGLGFFWPGSLVQLQTTEGMVLGEITAREAAHGSQAARIQVKVANRDLFGQDFRWIQASSVVSSSTPVDVVSVERRENGMFFGRISALSEHGAPLPGEQDLVAAALSRLPRAQALAERIRDLELREGGELNHQLEDLRLERRSLELKGQSTGSIDAKEQAIHQRFEELQGRLETLRKEARAVTLTLQTVDGQTAELPLGSVVRLVPNNTLGLIGKTRVYASRLWEFLADDPREANTEGGIFPAIFGTVMMVLIMSILVVPFGVLAALFLREYARDGWLVRTVRICVNNLAGVPSIVFGVFGLGFFVVTVGGTLDHLFFPERFPSPTFKTGGILWASLTLALLTVPVVIVATEEALAAVPRSQREASLALGATKWQTLWNVVLPGASQGILTGLILAMARGAGEVAPLMLTGVVKMAPSMPLDGTFPFLHLDRKFMHLGFHIYDVGFQSPNSEAAKPMVFMTALLLLLIVLGLNLFALRLRRRLRERMGSSSF